jgi:hypothetical protein
LKALLEKSKIEAPAPRRFFVLRDDRPSRTKIALCEAKAVSPLRFATAVQDVNDLRAELGRVLSDCLAGVTRP